MPTKNVSKPGQRLAAKRQRKKEAAARRQKVSQDDKAKVICTELNRQGLMSRADYVLGPSTRVRT